MPVLGRPTESKSKPEKPKQAKPRYGIAEWYGQLVSKVSREVIVELIKSSKQKKSDNPPCPFRQEAEPGYKCSKKGGVCSIRQFEKKDDGIVSLQDDVVTLCPSRFWESNRVFRVVGKFTIGSGSPIVIREVPFLQGLQQEEAEGGSGSDAVGQIDAVLVNPNDITEWCALEIQAVYFSGEKMASHFEQFVGFGDGKLPFPDKVRRPDFRSSGPKRLMPQLQTKVPTLRRWGKKMVVVVDDPFFRSLGKFKEVNHISNCDILWFVSRVDTETGQISFDKPIMTTLESSIDALTAGVPKSKEEFESRIDTIRSSRKKSDRKKVLNLTDL